MFELSSVIPSSGIHAVQSGERLPVNLLPQDQLHLPAEERVLTDGKSCYTYEDLPALFIHIERQLCHAKVARQDVIELECDNTLAHAVTLLYLLEHEYSVVALSRRRSTRLGDQYHLTPSFCKYRISVASDVPRDAFDIPRRLRDKRLPQLRIIPKEQWMGELTASSRRLYLPTSGSTGSLKIAVHRHSRLLGNIMNCMHRFNLHPNDRVAIVAPIAHMYGLAAAFLPAIAAGASIDLQENSNIIQFLTREMQFRPNVVFLTPSFCEALLRFKRSSASYRLTVTAGDRLSPKTFLQYEDHFGCLVNLYGSTEMGAIATSSPEDGTELRSKTVSRLMPGVTLCQEMDIAEHIDPIDNIQELCIRHRYAFESYIDAQGRLVDPFKPQTENCYCTGDLVRIWPSGHLEILGRTDNNVNRNGMLVAFSDIEDALSTIEEIERVAVVSHGHAPRGKALIAFCVMQAGKVLPDSEIRKRCRGLLAAHALPDQILTVDTLPMLENGKIDRQELVRIASQHRFVELC